MVDYLSSMSQFNLDDYTAGADNASPLSDVSNGDAPMQSYTATGNGTGAFLDTSAQNAIFGGLSRVLDYALRRDAYQMGMPLNNAAATQQQVQIQRKQSNGMFLLLCGVGVYLAVK
jgi:hypothetical protein